MKQICIKLSAENLSTNMLSFTLSVNNGGTISKTSATRAELVSSTGLIVSVSDNVTSVTITGDGFCTSAPAKTIGIKEIGEILPPTVTTNSVFTSRTTTSVLIGGEVTVSGGSEIIERGICWSKTQNPTVITPTDTNGYIKNGTGLGTFSCNITGLSVDTDYYFRAFAKNKDRKEYGYGASVLVHTDVLSQTKQKPTVVTNVITENITGISVNAGGTINNPDSWSPISDSGLCYFEVTSTTLANALPTILDSVAHGDTNKPFVATMTGLTENKTYRYVAFVRFATGNDGVNYGSPIDFKATKAAIVVTPVVPTIKTKDVLISKEKGYLGKTADSGGENIVSPTSAVTQKGLVWGLNPNPKIDSTNKTTKGAGTDSFNDTMDGLTPGITYYVRAYAINGTGVGYGNELSFKTQIVSSDSPDLTTVPTVHTREATIKSDTSAFLKGEITNDGGLPILGRGFIYDDGSTPNYLTQTKVTKGTGSGVFTHDLIGMTTGVSKTIVAYAYNSKGPAYGESIQITPNVTVVAPKIQPMLPDVTSYTIRARFKVPNSVKEDFSSLTFQASALTTGPWVDAPSPTFTDVVNDQGKTDIIMEALFTNLTANTPYCFKAYVKNSFGNDTCISTILTLPVAVTPIIIESRAPGQDTSLDYYTRTKAVLWTNIIAGDNISEIGVIWSKTSNVDMSNHTGIFSIKSNRVPGVRYDNVMDGLTPATKYYFKVYAVNSRGTVPSVEYSFTTNSVGIPILDPLGVPSFTNYGQATMSCGVADNQGEVCSKYGFLWGTSANPPYIDNAGTMQNTVRFYETMADITEDFKYEAFDIPYDDETGGFCVNYQVVAYAKNSAGYGLSKNPVAVSAIMPPNIFCDEPNTITTTSVALGGKVEASIGCEIVVKGIKIADNVDFVSSTKIPGTPSTGIGVFTCAKTGLTQDTVYFVRAYATINNSYLKNKEITSFSRSFRTVASAPIVQHYYILTNCVIDQQICFIGPYDTDVYSVGDIVEANIGVYLKICDHLNAAPGIGENIGTVTLSKLTDCPNYKEGSIPTGYWYSLSLCKRLDINPDTLFETYGNRSFYFGPQKINEAQYEAANGWKRFICNAGDFDGRTFLSNNIGYYGKDYGVEQPTSDAIQVSGYFSDLYNCPAVEQVIVPVPEVVPDNNLMLFVGVAPELATAKVTSVIYNGEELLDTDIDGDNPRTFFVNSKGGTGSLTVTAEHSDDYHMGYMIYIWGPGYGTTPEITTVTQPGTHSFTKTWNVKDAYSVRLTIHLFPH
jgi:hypothetical protein